MTITPKKYRRQPPFVALTWQLLNSKAYEELRPSAAKSLPYFLGKVLTTYTDPARYQIEFDFSYKEGRRRGFANTTHYRNICDLIEKGFIDPVSRGGLRGGGLSSSTFRLSKRWETYGTCQFQAGPRWNTITPTLSMGRLGRAKAASKLKHYSSISGS